MSKKNAVRLISLTVALFVVILGTQIKEKKETNYYKLQLENEYSKAVEDLTVGLNNISLLLQKGIYSNEEEMSGKLATEIITEAQISKNALSRLPIDSENTKRLNKFLSQVGNFTLHLSKSLAAGEKISKKEIKGMQSLIKSSKKISEIINDTHAKYNNLEYWSKEIEKNLPEENISSAMGEIEEELNDYPTLIYDGPFSDHLLEKEPIMISNAKEVTQEMALSVASKVCTTMEKDLNLEGTIGGHIDAFAFANENVSVAVSRFGGYPVYMRKNRTVFESHLEYNQALENAKRYLDEIGISNLIETYYYTNEGICVINFAYLDGETICYTDLIKVGVAMDTGETMLYEASGYLANHSMRAFETPKYTEEQARQLLNKNLTVKKTSIALIPSNNQEKRCYEFLCVGANNEEILVYINTSTLKEEEILILLRQDGGILVK